MNFIPVVSSNLSAVAYEVLTRTLYIRFHSTDTYAYWNVPESVYHGLMTATSKGGYHADYIKDRYRFRKVNPG